MTHRALLAPDTSGQGVSERFDELRKALVQRRSERIKQIVELTRERSSGLSDSQVQVSDAVRCSALAGLVDTDAALRRLNDGCYGLCERCGFAIEPERLEVLPMAKCCTPCQYDEEAAAWRGG